MKLHIPTLLRSALLASFAVFSTFSTTVATGALIVGAMAALSTQAQAQTIQQIVRANTGLISGWSDIGADGIFVGNFEAGFIGGNYARGVGGEFQVRSWNQTGGSSSEMVYVQADLADFTLTDAQLTAAGVTLAEVSETGDIRFSVAAVTMNHNTFFDGDHSAFSGDMIMAVNANFGKDYVFRNRAAAAGDTLTAISGTGAIEFGLRTVESGDLGLNAQARDVIYFYRGNVSIDNSVINADSLVLNYEDGWAVSATDRAAVTTAFNTSNNTQNVPAAGAIAHYTISSQLSLNSLVMNDASDATLTGTAVVGTISAPSADSVLSIGATGDLTVTERLELKSTIANEGTVRLDAGVIIDLSDFAFEDNRYAVFSGGGTLVGWDALSIDNLLGIRSVVGLDLTFEDDGSISLLPAGEVHVYNGGTLNWASMGTTFDAATGEFENNDSVNFASGTSIITLTSAVSAARVDIVAGATLELSSSNPATNQLNSAGIVVGGTLNLEGDVLADASRLQSLNSSARGTVVFDIGAGQTLDYEDQLQDFSGIINVASGNLNFNTESISGGATFDLEAEIGAEITITQVSFATENDVTITLRGGDVPALGEEVDTAQAAKLTLNNLQIRGDIITEGLAWINTAGLTVVNQDLTGSGYIYKTGGAELRLVASTTHTGVLDVTAGTLSYGVSDGVSRTNDFERIIVRENSTFTFQSAATDFNTIQLDGGTFRAFDMNNGIATLSRLEVSKSSTIQQTHNSQWVVEALVGEGDLDFTINPSAGGQFLDLDLRTITDYHGELDFNNNQARYDLSLGEVNQGENRTLTISNLGENATATDFVMRGAGTFVLGTGLSAASVNLEQSGAFTAAAVTTSSFHQSGSGSSTLSSLSIENDGLLTMTYNGTLRITNGVTLGDAATLLYGNEANTLQIDAERVNAGAALSINLLAISTDILEGGYELRIDSAIGGSQLTFVGLSNSSYRINDNDGFWRFTLIGEFDIPTWDPQWGSSVLAGVPTEISTADDLSGTTFLNTVADYVDADAGTTAVILAGGTGNVFGGRANAGGVTTDTWIYVSGGEWNNIAGGNRADFGGGSDNFTGDSHIVVNQTAADSSVDFIIGGNFTDGNAAVFTGDSYLSIFTDTVRGSIIGGSTTGHSSTPSFNGNTNIYIYTPLTVSEEDLVIGAHGAGNLGSSFVIGSNAWGSNVNGVMTHRGHVNVSVDLEDYAGAAASFAKHIYGSSVLDNGADNTQVGNGHISIVGHADVTFNHIISGGSLVNSVGSIARVEGDTHLVIQGNGSLFDSDNGVGIMGGDYNNAGGTSQRLGDITVEINGLNSTFNDRVSVAGQVRGGNATIDGTAFLTINGGTYNDVVMGGFNQHNGTTEIDHTQIRINGGTFASAIASGGVHSNGIQRKLGTSELSIVDGSISSVYGGSLSVGQGDAVTTSVTNTTEGLTNVLISGGSISGNVVGGSGIAESFGGTLTADGGVNIMITGGTVEGHIIGGHERTAGTAATSITMGDVSITLNGGTVNGDVYAAGYLEAELAGGVKSTTASATVTIGKGVAFQEGSVVSAGFGGAGAASGELLRDGKLRFTGIGTHDDIAEVDFIGFVEIDVTQENGFARLNSLEGVTYNEKRGAGRLAFSFDPNGRTLNIREGGLILESRSNTVNEIIIDSAHLNLQGNSLTVNGNFIVTSATAALTMDYAGAGIDIAASGVVSLDRATARLALTLTGAPVSNINKVLFDGIDTIDGLTFGILDNGETGILANSFLSSINSETDIGDFYLVARDGQIVLTDVLARDLFWTGADDTWDATNADWKKDSLAGADLVFKDQDNVFFTNGTDDITLEIDATVREMHFSHTTAATYTFAGTQALTVQQSLNVGENITVAMGAGLQLDLSSAAVDIETGGALQIADSTDLTIKSLHSAGTLTLGAGTVTITELVSQGGSLSFGAEDAAKAQHLNLLGDGVNRFSSISAKRVTAENLALGSAGDAGLISDIGTFDGTQLAIASGTVSIDTVENAFESFSNEGTLNVTESDITFASNVNTGGVLSAQGVTFESTANSFATFSAGAVVLAADASLTVTAGSSRITSLAGDAMGAAGGSLMVNGATSSMSITSADATTLAMVGGTGSLSTAGDLILTGTSTGSIGALTVDGAFTTAGAFNAGTLTVNQLNLAGAVSASELLDLTAAPLGTISVNYSLEDRAPVITARSISANNLQFNLDKDILNSLELTNGNSYTIASSTEANSISALFLNAEGQTVYEDGSSHYSISAHGNDIVIALEVVGNSWVGGSAGEWSVASNWDSNAIPVNAVAPDGYEAILAGDTGATINLGGAVSATELRVEMTSDGTYTLSDGELTTQRLLVNFGSLMLENVDVKLADGAIGESEVVIRSSGALELDADSSLDASTITLNGTARLTNAGSIEVDTLIAENQIITNTGELTLGDGSSIATVAGAEGIVRISKDATVSIRSLENEVLDLGDNGTLRVGDNLALSTMIGAGQLRVGNGTDGLALTVRENSSGISSGSLHSDQLTLEAGSSARFDALEVNTVNLLGDLNTTDARLTADSIAKTDGASGVLLNISEDTIRNMAIVGGEATSYKVYTQTGAAWSLFAFSDEAKDAITARVVAGEDVLLTQVGDTLTLTVDESTDRTWNTSQNFAVTASEGSSLSVLQPIVDPERQIVNYAVLDTVDRVLVTEDSSIDLRAITGGSLNVANLTGVSGTTLSIIGDGATQDAVTLKNTETSFAQNDIHAQGVTLTVDTATAGARLETGQLNLDRAILDASAEGSSITVAGLSNISRSRAIEASLVKGLVSVNGEGGVYTGNYEAATINAQTGAHQTLQAGAGLSLSGSGGHLLITDAAGSNLDAIHTTGAHITIDLTGARSATDSLTLDSPSTVSNGGSLTLLLNKDYIEAGETITALSGGSLTLSEGSELILTTNSTTGNLSLGAGGINTVLVELSNISAVDGQITLDPVLSRYYTNVRFDTASNSIVADINQNFYTGSAQTENGASGLAMLSNVLITVNPQANATEFPDLANALRTLDTLIGGDDAAADRLASSMAGASTAGLGMAVSGDMTRQLRSIRNRTMVMGSTPGAEMPDELVIKGWINAEGDSNQLSGDGTAAGYDLSSWGGTLGTELDINERYSVGLALSSMYGRYSSSDLDTLDGDLNTNYVTFFARGNSGRWSHSFVASLGISDISATRRVSHAGGGYQTQGSTDGTSFGLLYELAYTYALTEDSSTAWQPLVSLSFQSSQVDAYSETGSDAALHVGEQSMAYATLGVGARLETIIGENLYNRASVLSLRAMAEADFGDNQSEADVRFTNGTLSRTIKSAERGQLGLELGVGIQIPVSMHTGSIFMDATYEVRENQNNVNATVGYRFSF